MLHYESGKMMSPLDHTVYKVIENNPGIGSMDITKKCKYHQRSVRLALTRLRSLGYVKMRPDLLVDARRRLYWVTPIEETSAVPIGPGVRGVQISS